ncbi:hypothetical protein HDU85_000516 [Gaertneriomyces sp. JEL0708]|nr:hypothetical protein HDU85_000516 [Gaertneriomyces sp. JEL0708]
MPRSEQSSPLPAEQSDHVFVSDAVNSVLADADDMISGDISRVLILYTGGTIGMKNTPEHGYLPVPGYLSQTLSAMTRFHDPMGFAETVRAGTAAAASVDKESTKFPLTNAVNVPLRLPDEGGARVKVGRSPHPVINGTPVARVRKPALITPPSLYGKRIRYSILEYDPLLDSSNMTMKDWTKIATDIEVNYALFDAFIVLHGTDTMAFTASALSFMFEDLGKTVILTGSQVPLAEIRNDAVDNLLGALTIAGHFVIPEVGLFFNNKLFRGNRSSKVDAVDFNAFDSPNLRPLVQVGINIDVSWLTVLRPTSIAKFQAHKTMEASVAALRLFPGITEATVRAFLSPPVKGVVLETYGSGNAPNNRPDILAALREASERGVVIVNCTQCKRGLVTDLYATGKALLAVGVVPGSDMTPECALTKLSYLLGKGHGPAECRSLMRRNLRGELTVPNRRQRFSYQQGTQGLVQSVLALLPGREKDRQTEGEDLAKNTAVPEESLAGLERALIPMLLCQAARCNDIDGLQVITSDYNQLISVGDYDGRTPLHIAASENAMTAVEFLLLHGANVHLRDRFGHSPLYDALRCRNAESAHLLRQAGAHFGEDELEMCCVRMISAVSKGDLDMVKLLVECGADLNRSVVDGRTALHVAAKHGSVYIVQYIIAHALQVAVVQNGSSVGPSNNSGGVSGALPLTPPVTAGNPFTLSPLRSGIPPRSETPPFEWHRPSTPTTSAQSSTTSLQIPSWVSVNLESVDAWGRTPKDEAQNAGWVDIVKMLEDGLAKQKLIESGAEALGGVVDAF